MTAQRSHLRLLRPEETNAGRTRPRNQRKAGGRVNCKDMPGLHRPGMRCKECAGCTSLPKKSCLNPGTQEIWRYHKSVGGELYRASTGCTDLSVAKAVARDLLQKWEREQAGLPTIERLALDDAVLGFEKHLTTCRGGEEQQRSQMRMLREVIEEARKVAPLGHVDQLTEEAYADWLPYAKQQGWGHRNINKRIQVLRRFGTWLRGSRRLDHNPFEMLRYLSEREDPRHPRRAMWPRECKALLRAALRRQIEAEQAKNARAKTEPTPHVVRRRNRRLHFLRRAGFIRALVYFLALRTGLRKDECKRIRIRDVLFDRGRIRVPPKVAKSRYEQYVEMDEDLARRLRSRIRRLGDVPDTAALFGVHRGPGPGPRARTWVPSSRVFNRDLAAAGIEKKDATDLVVDFHALRKSFITHLRMRNVPVEDAQRLARHSDIKLTLDVYSDYEKLAGREKAAAEALVGLWK